MLRRGVASCASRLLRTRAHSDPNPCSSSLDREPRVEEAFRLPVTSASDSIIPSMADPEPFDSFADDAKQLARSLSRRIFERGREWLTRQLVTLMVGAVASGALAIVVLPIFAGLACGLVALAAVVYAVWARRLMESERRNRRWAYVQGKRIQQRELRALAAVDAATLAICGDRQARFSGRSNPELTQALAHLQAQVRRSAAAAQPQPAGAGQRQPALPASPDLAAVRQSLQRRQTEIEALEAEIQALAVPGDDKLAQDAAERRQAEQELTDATRRAERAARERRLRGQQPSRPPGEEIGLQVEVGPEGVRQVRQAESSATPEQIAAAALRREPPPS